MQSVIRECYRKVQNYWQWFSGTIFQVTNYLLFSLQNPFTYIDFYFPLSLFMKKGERRKYSPVIISKSLPPSPTLRKTMVLLKHWQINISEKFLLLLMTISEREQEYSNVENNEYNMFFKENISFSCIERISWSYRYRTCTSDEIHYSADWKANPCWQCGLNILLFVEILSHPGQQLSQRCFFIF